MRLNDLSLRQLPLMEKGQQRYFDESTPGFGVTVGVNRKTFFVVRGKTRKLTTIGAYPSISLQDARKAAKRLLVQEPEEATSTGLVEAVARYLEAIEGTVRPSTIGVYRRYLSPAPDIALQDLKKFSVPLTVPNAIKSWKVFANWCVREELLDRNPFQYVPVVYGERSRVLTNDEIRAIWQYEYLPMSDIIKLCLLTGQRKGEVTRFNAGWIHGDTITIPATVAKNHNAHTLPFNLLTAYYLKRYCGQSFNGFSKGKARMDREVPIAPWTIHDLRRTFSTIHAKLGTPIHLTERLLNHTSGTISGVAAIYNRYNYLDEMRAAALKYEVHIANIVE